MSVPEKHHFLPVFYLNRWATGGKLVRFVRPRGPDHPTHFKVVSPKAVAYEPHLYAMPTAATASQRQMLEVQLYQRIDDRAAIALEKIDKNKRGSAADRIAFAQFVLSLCLRNPAHIEQTRQELKKRVGPMPRELDFDDLIKTQVNIMLAELIQSQTSVEMLAKMRVFQTQHCWRCRTIADIRQTDLDVAQSNRSRWLHRLPIQPD